MNDDTSYKHFKKLTEAMAFMAECEKFGMKAWMDEDGTVFYEEEDP